MLQYVKSVSGTWHVATPHTSASSHDGGLLVQTQCDRLVKVARLLNTKPSKGNPMSWCCECRWTE